MRHQFAFGWYAFMALTSTMTIALSIAERIQHGPREDWWTPLLFAGLTAFCLTRIAAIAKKNWHT